VKVFEKWLAPRARQKIESKVESLGLVKKISYGLYRDAEEKLAQHIESVRASGTPITPLWVQEQMLEIMAELHPDALTKQKPFKASNRWLLGGKSGRRVIFGFMHRFGYSFRVPTKKKAIPLEELLLRVKLSLLGCFSNVSPKRWRSRTRSPLRDLPGDCSLDFQRLFRRVLSTKASKMVLVKRSRKELGKRFATLLYIARAEGKQPPPILILKGKPQQIERKIKGKIVTEINTRKPSSWRLLPEMLSYSQGVWVYFDPKFRTSVSVLHDVIVDLKQWLRENNEADHVCLGLDNLREQCSVSFQKLALEGKPRLKLAFTPENTTDLCAVTDYDIGRLDKTAMREQFLEDFRKRPMAWVKKGKDGGVSESEFRVLLTRGGTGT